MSNKGAKVAISRARLLAVLSLGFVSLFVGRAFGGVVLVSRQSNDSYQNTLGASKYSANPGDTASGTFKNSLPFQKIDAAGSSGSTLSQETTDVHVSNGSLLSSGELLTQATAQPMGTDPLQLLTSADHEFVFKVVGQNEPYHLMGDFGSQNTFNATAQVQLEPGDSVSGSHVIYLRNNGQLPRFETFGELKPGTYLLDVSLGVFAARKHLTDSSRLTFSFEVGPAASAIPLPPAWASGGALLAIVAAAHALRRKLAQRVTNQK